jgi:hypothetical protein
VKFCFLYKKSRHDKRFGNSAKYLKYWQDTSFNSYGSYGYASLSDTGMFAWNNISSNLGVSEVTSEPTYYSIVSYVGNTISGMDVYGVVDYWQYSWWGWNQVNPDDLRDRARVRFDHTNINSLPDTPSKQYVFTHEYGHAVGLKHNNGTTSVMRDTNVDWTKNMPQTADKNHITQKYGY